VAEGECCPRLNEADWDKKEMEWRGKPFYRTKYWSIFHMPLNIGGVTTKAMAELDSKGLVEDPTLMLSREESMFSSTLLLSMNQDTDDPKVERLSGNYVSRLFQGSYRDTSKWIKETMQYCEETGREARDLLFWYVTCPKCAEKYGGAQTVIFAKVD